MTEYGIFLTAVTRTGEPVNEWVLHYDPDDRGGGGFVELTDDPAQAMRFVSPIAAMTAWQAQSVTRPLREDGQPNKPLTAFTARVKPLPEVTV